jgi:hypothetical protein
MKLHAWSGRRVSWKSLRLVAISGWSLAAFLQFFSALVAGDGGYSWGMFFSLIIFASWLTTIQPDNEVPHPSLGPS